MFEDENQAESHLQRASETRVMTAQPDAEVQRKRMLIALGILLVALGVVIVKDWEFWFPTRTGTSTDNARKGVRTVEPESATTAPATTPKEHKAAGKPAEAEAQAPFTATTERAALPPLQVEVVAGNRHTSVPTNSTAIRVDVGSGETSAASASAKAMMNSGERVQLTPQAQQNVAVTVPPDYPLLARQMKVQGSVSLQALISREGMIQELQILRGPEILAAAAREAVKQWHFKPYLQNGQPVETQARITVNFTISTN